MIAGTCAGVQGNQEVRERTFALAVLEEAGKATPPEALMLVLRSRKSILVGDSRQLPPHIWDPMRDVLRKPTQLTSGNPTGRSSKRDPRRDRSARRHPTGSATGRPANAVRRTSPSA